MVSSISATRFAGDLAIRPAGSDLPGPARAWTAATASSGRSHRVLMGEHVFRRMQLEALHLLVHERENTAPERLHDRPFLLHDDFRSSPSPCCVLGVEHALGLVSSSSNSALE